VSINGDGFTTEVAMAALTMDDLLVGAKNPDKAHMARSCIVWDEHQHQHHSQQILQQLVQQQAPADQQRQAEDAEEVATPAPGTESSKDTPGTPVACSNSSIAPADIKALMDTNDGQAA